MKYSKALKKWFTVHFIIDVIIAIPLMIAPEALLIFMGWEVVDPITTRLVAAALFGIGIESFLGRNSSKESFISMLNLKIIWSLAAIIGLGISLYFGAPKAVWLILAIFIVFNLVWVYYRQRLN